MARQRTTRALTFEDAKNRTEYTSDHFRTGVLKAGRWQNNADATAFKTPLVEMLAKEAEYHARVMDTEVSETSTYGCARKRLTDESTKGLALESLSLARGVKEIIGAMPYLTPVNTDTGKVHFFHPNNDYPVGYVSSNGGYCMKRYVLFSPLTADKQRGGTSSDYMSKIVSEARRLFKFAPPDNMLPFLAVRERYSEFTKLFRRDTEKVRRLHQDLKFNNSGSSEVHDFLTALHVEPSKRGFLEKHFESVTKKLDKRQARLQSAIQAAKRIGSVAFVVVTGTTPEGQLLGKTLYVYRPFFYNRAQVTHPNGDDFLLNADFDAYASEIRADQAPPMTPSAPLPDDIVMGIATLSMMEKDETINIVPDVGLRMSDTQFILYCDPPDDVESRLEGRELSPDPIVFVTNEGEYNARAT